MGTAIVTGAVEETRTLTPFGTAPSRRRVYQFHHDGNLYPQRSGGVDAGQGNRYFGTSRDFSAGAAGAGAEGAGAAGFTSALDPAGVSIVCVTPPLLPGAEK